jgi:carbon storage regulator
VTTPGNIVATIVNIRGDSVRLGIEAPKEIAVHRREVYDKIKSPESLKEVPTDDASGGT